MIENGRVVEFEDGQMRIGERLPGGYVFVDGAGVGDIGPGEVREREALARDGLVLVNLTLDRESSKLMEEPEIITRGFIQNQAGDELMEAARQMIKERGAQCEWRPAERPAAGGQVVPVQPDAPPADGVRDAQ